jgi:hypothetical protein
MTARLELHSSVRERFGQSLCYYFLSFSPPYDLPKATRAIVEFFRIDDVEAFAVHEIFGVADIIVRAWLPGMKVPLLERRLRDFLLSKNCPVAISEEFRVSTNPYHYVWPDDSGILERRDGSNFKSILDHLKVADLNDDETKSELQNMGLLREVNEQTDGIRVFISIPPSSRPLSISLMDGLVDDVREALKRSSLKNAVFYSGVGQHIAFLIEAMVPVEKYSSITEFNKKINGLGLQRFGLRTTTYLSTLPYSEPVSATNVPPWEAFAVGMRTANEYLTADESEGLEHKGSLELDIGRYAATGTIVKEPKLIKEVLSTVVAFLNSRGGELIIGAVEDGKFKGSVREKLSELFPSLVGEMRLIGIDWEYPTSSSNWDGYSRRLIDLINSRIGGSYQDFITIKRLPADSQGEKKSLCLIQVLPLPAPEVAYLDNDDCYVRDGAETKPLRGRNLRDFLSRRR